VLPVGNTERLRSLADDPHLLLWHANEAIDDHADNRAADIFAISFLDIPCQLRRGLAAGFQVFHEPGRELAIRPHNASAGEFLVAPDEDLHGIAGANHIVVVLVGKALALGYLWQVWLRATTDKAKGHRQCKNQYRQ
jgi:hypothetical protein